MASLKEWKIEKPWLETGCGLGEGPFFEKETNSIRFVDIKNKRIHWAPLSGDTASVETLQLNVSVGVTSNIAGVDPRERILIGIKNGIAVLDRKTGKYDLLAEFAKPNERLRGNDGAADPHGRFWFGNMTDFGFGGCEPEGSLNLFEGKSLKEQVLKDLTIPNGVGWSPDNKIMYFTHSSAGTVHAFDYDTETGAFSNKRDFYKHDSDADPDGFRVDKQGNIWHAVYGEGRVVQISPEGKVIGQVKVPTRNATCVQFAGTELVITTAADEDGDETSKKFGGSVFKVDVGVEGLDLFDFKL